MLVLYECFPAWRCVPEQALAFVSLLSSPRGVVLTQERCLDSGVSRVRAPREVVTAADIGRRLRLSPERIRQLARSGGFPRPAGRVGRNTLWEWEAVAHWAVLTGRLPQDGRLPPQVWAPRRARPRFERGIDCVIEWGHRSTVHVRVWSPISDGWRPVVLLGELDDNPGQSVTNGIETVALTVSAQLLGPQGLLSDWYQYGPDDALTDHEFHAVSFASAPPASRRSLSSLRKARVLGGELRDPQWSDVSRELLEDLVREEIEVYPGGAYTKEAVKRFVSEGRFVQEWDPAELRRDVEGALALVDFGSKDLSARTRAVAIWLLTRDLASRVAENAGSAAKEPRGSAIQLLPYEPDESQLAAIGGGIANTRKFRESDVPDDDIPEHQRNIRSWLSRHGTEQDQLLLTEGSRGLAWLEPWQVGMDVDELDEGSPIVWALRRADRRLSEYLSEHDPGAADEDFPVHVPSDLLAGTSRWSRMYLNTVSWWGPHPDHDLRRRRLEVQLDKDRAYVSGYDPWGRLVMRQGNSFVVEWPVGPPASNPPDEAEIVAVRSERAISPVFIKLPDGRLDLLPASPDDPADTAFTWGYAGGGPFNLARALYQLILGHQSHPGQRGWDSIDSLVKGVRGQTFRVSLRELRSQLAVRTGAA